MNRTLPVALARLGDSIECDLRFPYQRTLAMRLLTQQSVAYGNHLLMTQPSTWRLSHATDSRQPTDGDSHE